jgi:hypothetical protein
MFGLAGIGSVARATLAALALVTALGAATVTPAVAAPGDSVSSGTDAVCLGITDAMAGVTRKQLTAAFPTGTTGGKTYLAARIESQFPPSGPTVFQPWATWANGTSWIHTTATKFPLGQFNVNGTWYRNATVSWAEHWLNTSFRSRVNFLVQFPDGRRVTVYSRWVMC